MKATNITRATGRLVVAAQNQALLDSILHDMSVPLAAYSGACSKHTDQTDLIEHNTYTNLFQMLC